MPVIKVWCLPAKQTEEDLNRLHQEVVKAVVSIEELGLKSQEDMTLLFPPDQMQYGLGSEIIIEVSGLFVKPKRTFKIREALAASIGCAVKAIYRKAKVEVFVTTFNPKKDGFWVSKEGT